MRFALSKVDLAMFFMAPTWPPKEAYADDTSDRCQLWGQTRHIPMSASCRLVLQLRTYHCNAADDARGQRSG